MASNRSEAIKAEQHRTRVEEQLEALEEMLKQVLKEIASLKPAKTSKVK